MSKFFLLKQKFKSLTVVITVILITVGFSMFLGKYYLNNIVKSYPVGKTIYKKVYYQVEIKKIRLNPVPIYTFQAGVFLDVVGAEEFAKSLYAKGLRPYITPVTPYKVLLFAASSREELEIYKPASPKDVFVVTEILNAREVEFSGEEKELVTFLTQFTSVFSDTLSLIQKGDEAREKALAVKWQELASILQKESLSAKKNRRILNQLTEDCEAMAIILNSPHTTLQEQGNAALVILQAKYDFDNFRQILTQL